MKINELAYILACERIPEQYQPLAHRVNNLHREAAYRDTQTLTTGVKSLVAVIKEYELLARIVLRSLTPLEKAVYEIEDDL